MGMKRIIKYISGMFGNMRADYDNFDHEFYSNTYIDLKKLRSKRKLYRHYVRYGRAEGRFSNLSSAIFAAEQRFGALPDDFTIASYRALNPDLFHFGHDDLKYVEHFLEFGRSEGRMYRPEDGHAQGVFISLPGSREEVKNLNLLAPMTLSAEDQWAASFSVPDFLVWSAPWRSAQVAGRAEALDLFIANGVRELCPINNEMIFDPEFYRSQHMFDASIPNEKLYLHWLKVGFPAGYAPNEDMAYQPYLGRSSYPEDFDYAAYAADVGLEKSDKLSALQNFFDTGYLNSDKYLKFIGKSKSDIYIRLAQYYLVRKMYAASERALAVAVQIDSKDTLIYHLLGDARRELGRLDEALESYRSAIALEDPSAWSFIHAARLASDLGRFDLAFAIALQAREQIESRQEYQSLVRDLIERYFAIHAGAARDIFQSVAKLGGSGPLRKQADKAMADILGVVEKRTRELCSFPMPLRLRGRGHVVIFGNDDLQQCTHYRIKQKIQQFESVGIDVEFVSHHSIEKYYNALIGASAVIFYRIAAFPKNIHAILTAKCLGIKTYYEIDDLIFDHRYYPDSYSSYEGQISTEEYAGLMWGVPLFRYAMMLCDIGIASTRPLLDQMEKIVGEHRCLLLPNGLDSTNAPSIRRGQSYRSPDDVLTIFYGSGTRAHNLDFTTLVEPAIIRLLREFDNVRLAIVGHLRLSEALKEFQSKIIAIPFVSNVDDYWSLLLGASINISVLARSKMSDCKSEIKWLEAAALGVPSVVSETAVYKELIRPGDTGFVANNPQEWYRALKALIVDPALRRSVGSAARDVALSSYSLEAGASILQAEFAVPKVATPVATGPRPLRVLICNVFFAPQSIGGATRVVEANVRHFQGSPSEIETMIFCSDEGAAPAGRVRFDSDGYSNVIRLSTPLEQDMDWRPFNEDNRDAFARVIDAYQPDIIHFHCVQRLTAVVVAVALEKKIPYCVTIHDGWWVGDDQFMIDANGFLKMPGREVLQSGTSLRHSIQSSVRRIKLGALLTAADARLTVSESFADIYRDAGVDDVLVIENGIARPDFRAPDAARSSGKRRGPLRLAHIGGRSAHKGAVLIEGLFRRSRFADLELLMIDGRLRAGERVDTVWGETKVVLCGPYPQSRIGDLYDRFDVLLAPSTWPESYGLVSREALLSGKWVVATTMGAMGECVTEGENGFLVDPADPDSLEKVLSEMNSNPQRYKTAPIFDSARIKSADEQAEALLRLYRSIVDSRAEAAPDMSPG